MNNVIGMTVISLGIAPLGWILSIGWYQMTRRDEVDRDTMTFFAKLWIGIGLSGILMYLLIKYV